MNDIANIFNQVLAIALASSFAIQLYISNDKIQNKNWRIFANVIPVFVMVGVVLFMRYGK